MSASADYETARRFSRYLPYQMYQGGHMAVLRGALTDDRLPGISSQSDLVFMSLATCHAIPDLDDVAVHGGRGVFFGTPIMITDALYSQPLCIFFFKINCEPTLFVIA